MTSKPCAAAFEFNAHRTRAMSPCDERALEKEHAGDDGHASSDSESPDSSPDAVSENCASTAHTTAVFDFLSSSVCARVRHPSPFVCVCAR